MEGLIRSFFATANKNEEKWSGYVRLQRHPYFHLNVLTLTFKQRIFFIFDIIFARYLMLAKKVKMRFL